MPADFSIPSFSSGQNKPLSQRAELCSIQSFLACYEVIRDKEENTKKKNKKTSTALILLKSLDKEVWAAFSQRKLKVCKLTIEFILH